MIYEKLLSQVINIHFPENKFDLKGKLEWYPVTEKEKTRYLERTGKELKNQRRKYKITDVFWKKSADEEKIPNPYYFNHILISEIEQNEIFYCIYEHKRVLYLHTLKTSHFPFGKNKFHLN